MPPSSSSAHARTPTLEAAIDGKGQHAAARLDGQRQRRRKLLHRTDSMMSIDPRREYIRQRPLGRQARRSAGQRGTRVRRPIRTHRHRDCVYSDLADSVPEGTEGLIPGASPIF
jgi:hypothetical protein